MSKKYFALLIFISVISSMIHSEDAYLYGKRVLEIKNELSGFYPREENSNNEKKLFLYLEDHFDEMGVDYSLMDYSLLEKGHSFSKGYSVSIKGLKDDLLVIAVPLNHKTDQNSSHDGSINIAIALQLLEIFQNYTPPVSIEFLFLGAERGPAPDYPIGSNSFLNNFAAANPTILLYLDMYKEADLITIKNSSNNDLSPMWMVEQLTELFLKEKIKFSTDSIQSLAYQSGFESAPAIINSYLENEVPAIILESRYLDKQALNGDQWVNSFIESILSFILNNKNGFDKEWGRHYFISVMGNFLISLGEKEGLFMMISLLAFLLFVILMRSRSLHLNLKRFRKHFWTFPLLLFLTFMYLFISTLVIEEISNIRNFPTLWQQYPIQFLLFKICSTIFLYSGFIYLVRGLSISRSHHFYTYSAFISVIISMITVLIYNINFAYFFLWSLIMVSVFMTSRNELVKRISIILSPLPLIIICYLIFSYPYLEICGFLLTSRVTGNLFLTIIIMPTLMLISSLNYFHHRFYRHRRSFRNIFSIIFWGSMTLLVLYNINSSFPYSVFSKQPVYIDEKIDLNQMSRSILLNSPAPIGDVMIELDEQKLNLRGLRRSAEVTAPIIADLLEIEEEYSTFLDRMRLNYTIKVKGSPDFLNIQLFSENPLIIFDSNFPYERTVDSKKIVFHIGKNPEIPLNLTFILPRGSAPIMGIQVLYSDFPYSFKLAGDQLHAEKKLSVIKEIEWNH